MVLSGAFERQPSRTNRTEPSGPFPSAVGVGHREEMKIHSTQFSSMGSGPVPRRRDDQKQVEEEKTHIWPGKTRLIE